MKKITAKVITISSQILVVILFLLSLFVGEGSNDKVTVIYNNNFDKMADRTLFLFEKEQLMTSHLNENVVVVLEDNTEKELDEVVQEETITEETALIALDNDLQVSSRKLGIFYKFKKRISLACYKLFVKAPKQLAKNLGFNLD